MLTELILKVLLALVMSIGIILLVWHISMLRILKKYRELYRALERGIYKYDGSVMDQIYFKKFDYHLNPTNGEIIFFNDGSIKLEENLYIHKSLILFHLAGWYYYRKFQRLKDDAIREYNFRLAHDRMSRDHHERYMKQQNKLDFKFLRG